MRNKKLLLLSLLFVSSLIGQINIKPVNGYGVKGGLGGYSGNQLSGAASSSLAPTTTTALPTGMVDQGLSPALQNSIGSSFTPTAGVNKGVSMANVTMPNTGKALGTFSTPQSGYLNRLGDGSTFKGAAKLGAIGLPAIGAAAMPDYSQTEDPMSKYDPKRRLNLGMTTGIQNALNRDSSLRLNQFAEGGYLPYRFQDSGNFTPEDQEAYRQYMTLREYNSNRREPSKDVVYDEGLQAIENERARSMRDPQSVENLRAYQMRDKVTDEEERVRYQSLFDSFARDRAELDAMPEGPEKDSLIEGNDNFTREEFNMGGYLETGMGDGMSDDISTSIDGEQPAALSEGEFVVPADVVSGLGNGSSDAGAEQLYAMMDRIRKARTGTEKQGREIMPQEYMPA